MSTYVCLALLLIYCIDHQCILTWRFYRTCSFDLCSHHRCFTDVAWSGAYAERDIFLESLMRTDPSCFSKLRHVTTWNLYSLILEWDKDSLLAHTLTFMALGLEPPHYRNTPLTDTWEANVSSWNILCIGKWIFSLSKSLQIKYNIGSVDEPLFGSCNKMVNDVYLRKCRERISIPASGDYCNIVWCRRFRKWIYLAIASGLFKVLRYL